jgi:hypothetical protein
MKNIIVRSSHNTYNSVCQFLINKHDFKDLSFKKSNAKMLASKKQIMLSQFRNLSFLIRNIKQLHNTNIVFSIGYITLLLIMLRKLRLISYKKIYW